MQQWNPESLSRLQGALDCIDWDVFVNANPNLNSLTETVTDYINFCTDIALPSKQVKIFPNNKPWITKSVKDDESEESYYWYRE